MIKYSYFAKINIKNSIKCKLLCFFLCCGCSVKQALKKDEYLLYKTKITGNKEISTYDLEGRLRQTPNTLIFNFYPFDLKLYLLGLKRYSSKLERNVYTKRIESYQKEFLKDSIRLTKKYDNAPESGTFRKKLEKQRNKRDKKIESTQKIISEGNFLMRIGEAPVVYDSSLTQISKSEIKKYLATKGFYNPEVTVKEEIDNQKRRVRVTYEVKEGKPHLIDSVWYITTNAHIDSILKANPFQIEVGKRFNESKIDEERVRIEALLFENGYFRFSRDYIKIEIDTSIYKTELIPGDSEDGFITVISEDNLMKIRFLITNPEKRDTTLINENTFGNATAKIHLDNILGEHIQYKIKDVYFVISDENNNIDTTRSLLYPPRLENAIHFNRASLPYCIKVLNRKIFIRPERIYKKSNEPLTQRILGSLDLFKFINFRYEDDKRGGLTSYIITKPTEKFALSSEVGLNIATNQNIPGPYINFNFRSRNPFGGCGLFESNLLFSVDGQASFVDVGNVYQTTQLSINSSYTFPFLLFPGRFKFKESINEKNPRSRISLGYDYTKRPEYTRTNWRSSLTYQFQSFPYKTYNITPLDLNFISTPQNRQSLLFRETLENWERTGNILALSFRNALITSSSAFYQYTNIDQATNINSQYFKIFGEVGGLMLNLLDRRLFQEGKFFGLDYFKFFRLYTEYRHYFPLKWGTKTTFVTRAFIGAGLPYNDSQTLPYEKFFFAGGINSIRAWLPRRLGPGAYRQTDSITGNVIFNLEQPGNIILETNAELRFKVVSALNMALFVDAGNTWSTLVNEKRQGAAFTEKFYEQIAVGTGFGFRFDFTFLIMRVDIGIKTIDPGRLDGNFALKDFNFRSPFVDKSGKLFSLGFAIGYPF